MRRADLRVVNDMQSDVRWWLAAKRLFYKILVHMLQDMLGIDMSGAFNTDSKYCQTIDRAARVTLRYIIIRNTILIISNDHFRLIPILIANTTFHVQLNGNLTAQFITR